MKKSVFFLLLLASGVAVGQTTEYVVDEGFFASIQNMFNQIVAFFTSRPDPAAPEHVTDSSFWSSLYWTGFDGFFTYTPDLSRAVCPIAQFDVLNTTYTMSWHCDFLNQHSYEIASIANVVYLLSSFKIVLSA